MAGTTIVDTLDTEEQIEEAKASLDRINGWINSCDSKAGTVLALTGVLLTIIFTNDGMAEMYKVLQNIFPPANFCTVIYIVFLGSSVFMLCYGIVRLILTLVARINSNIYECADKCFYVNTFMKMLNKLLKQHSLPEIKVGIGLSSAQELVVKAGRKGVGINSKIWIGKAVTRACHYANYGNKDGNPAIVFGSCSYNNMIDQLIKNNPDKNPKGWFTYHKDEGEGDYYTANIIKTGFDNWINSGMKID